MLLAHLQLYRQIYECQLGGITKCNIQKRGPCFRVISSRIYSVLCKSRSAAWMQCSYCIVLVSSMSNNSMAKKWFRLYIGCKRLPLQNPWYTRTTVHLQVAAVRWQVLTWKKMERLRMTVIRFPSWELFMILVKKM